MLGSYRDLVEESSKLLRFSEAVESLRAPERADKLLGAVVDVGDETALGVVRMGVVVTDGFTFVDSSSVSDSSSLDSSSLDDSDSSFLGGVVIGGWDCWRNLD